MICEFLKCSLLRLCNLEKGNGTKVGEKKLHKSLLWSLCERYVGLAISIVSTVVISRLLTPGEIGVYSLCSAFLAVATILRDFGVSEYIIQARVVDKIVLRASFGVAILVAWSVGLFVYIVGGVVSDFYNEPGVELVLNVLTINFLLLPIASPSFALLSREMRFRDIFIIQVCANFSNAAFSVIFVLFGLGYVGLAWATVVGNVVSLIVVAIIKPDGVFILPSFSGGRNVIAFGFKFCGIRLIETLSRNVHEFFIAKFFGFAPLGVFSKGLSLVELFYTAVTSAVLRVAAPAFAEDQRNGVSLKPGFCRGTAIFTGIAWPFFVFVGFSSYEILIVVFGHQWGAGEGVATILCVNAVLASFGALGPNVLIATGNLNRRLYISMSLLPIQVIGTAVAVFFTLETVAWVWVVCGLVGLALISRELSRIISLSLKEWVLCCMPSFFVSATLFVAQFGFKIAVTDIGLSNIAYLFLLSLYSSLVWLISIIYFSHPVYDEILKAFRRH